MNIKKVKELVDWMYSKDNPNQEKRWSKKIMLKDFMKQNPKRVVESWKDNKSCKRQGKI